MKLPRSLPTRGLLLAVVAVLILGFPHGPDDSTQAAPSPDAPGEKAAVLTCATPSSDCAPPDTGVALVKGDVSNAGGQIDQFAWDTFIAMNWPAIEPSEENGYLRGIPDTSQNFGAEALTVWETFKEKREVFNQGTVSGTTFSPQDPGPWNSAVDYGPLRAADGEKLSSPDSHPQGARVLHAATKQVFDALDETIEVLSEARETDKKIPTGSVVAPRVWRLDTATGDQTPVLYEVKVNYDFYDYVRQNQLWDDSKSQAKALKGEIHLPWRTSATSGSKNFPPKGTTPQNGTEQTAQVSGYSAKTTASEYRSLASSPSSPPPGIGSVHIKAAWIELTQKEIDGGTFHTTEAYSYTTNSEGQPVADLSTFGLIGLHIIQRVHLTDASQPSGGFQSAGGTFVFATWEHDSIQQSLDDPGSTKKYQYANFYDPSMNGLEGKGYFGQVFDVSRRPGAILSQTQQANAKAHETFPADSVWQNYDLIGTQFLAVDTSEVSFGTAPSQAETTLGQNSYLANLVIETNHGLQNFRGLPPGIVLKPSGEPGSIVPPYNNENDFSFTGNTKGGPVFDRDAKNLAGYGSAYTMGGCMGCHGVAQLQGFNFSFVLLGGNAGAKTDTESRFDLPLGKPELPPSSER